MLRGPPRALRVWLLACCLLLDAHAPPQWSRNLINWLRASARVTLSLPPDPQDTDSDMEAEDSDGDGPSDEDAETSEDDEEGAGDDGGPSQDDEVPPTYWPTTH